MDLSQLTDAIKSGNRKAAALLTQEAIDAKIEPRAILDSLIVGMDDIGARFQRNEVFVPEMLIAARAMKESMIILEPLLIAAGIRPEYTALIGTVQGDLHDIGKNLVSMMWKGANFNVVDLGTNVPPEKFVEAAKEHNPQIIGLSALLTTTMPSMKTTIEQLRAAGLTSTKIIIGGAPITQEFANQIGADAFAPDAASAVEVARYLVGPKAA
ncbi:MAG: corrinoid protein [Fimbriimonas sp.]|nr:corrinoid protein [Fimbriimonas sp.]